MIEILLASYNGEEYISEQIESILNQSFDDYHLTIRDDKSTDNTEKIIEKYRNKYPDKINYIKSTDNLSSAHLNFSHLIMNCDSEYVTLCDQDDYWLMNKLQVQFNTMKELEKQYGKDTSILIYSDLAIVDENLNVKYASFMDYKKLCKNPSLEQLLCENSITGCTCFFNKALLENLKNIPSKLRIHDWWIALVAKSLGYIHFIDKPLILYRQHDNNTIGAFKNNISINSIKHSLKYSYYQAFLLNNIYRNKINTNNYRIIRKYSTLPSSNKFSRINTILQNGYRKNSLKKYLAQLIFC